MSKRKANDGFTVKDRRSGFALIDNIVIDDYGPLIGAYGIAAYCILVRFARADGTDSYPSYQKVAELMGVCRNTAIKAIKMLVKMGLIDKESRRAKGESLSNSYTLIDVTRQQAYQVVGSPPNAPPSALQIPPSPPNALGSALQILPSASHAPDQYTNNNTPITIHLNKHDDDDDARGSPLLVKENSRARADREATRTIDAELLTLREAAQHMVEETLGSRSWDGWEKYRDQLSKEQLRLVCYWCKAVVLRWLSSKSDDPIENPVGLVRHGVDNGIYPGIPPIDQQSVDDYINMLAEDIKEPSINY